jgi:hypothetical protein
VKRLWLFSLLSVSAWSAVLYTDGPINAAYTDTPIYHVREATDSFVISSDSAVTGISNLGLWINSADVIETLSWVISTAADGGGTVEASGSAITPTLAVVGTNTGHTIYSASFAVSNLALSAGTYYLELFTCATVNDALCGWDELNPTGPSTADANSLSAGTPLSIHSESFEIDGNTAAPEPGVAGLSGIGLAMLAAVTRLRQRRIA